MSVHSSTRKSSAKARRVFCSTDQIILNPYQSMTPKSKYQATKEAIECINKKLENMDQLQDEELGQLASERTLYFKELADLEELNEKQIADQNRRNYLIQVYLLSKEMGKYLDSNDRPVIKSILQVQRDITTALGLNVIQEALQAKAAADEAAEVERKKMEAKSAAPPPPPLDPSMLPGASKSLSSSDPQQTPVRSSFRHHTVGTGQMTGHKQTPTRTPLRQQTIQSNVSTNLLFEIHKSGTKQLRKTELNRSPGGTPRVVRTKSDAHGIGSALQRKFRTVKFHSPSSRMAASVNDENEFSPMASPLPK